MGTMPHVPGTVRRIPHTRAQLAMSRPAGSPGSVLPPLRRAAPDRTIWRAPEIKDLPPDLAGDYLRRPDPRVRVTDARDAHHFARQATPQPTGHRTPAGLTRRSWRRYEPVNLGLPAEESGATLPSIVEDQPRRARPSGSTWAHEELAGLAVARRTGELVGIPIEPEAEPWDLGLAGAAPREHAAGRSIRQAEPAGLKRRPVRDGGRIRTFIDGEDVASGIAAEQPAPVALERLVRTALAHDLERARAASARAAASAIAVSRRAERSVASGVALLVLVASLIGVTPLSPSAGATGNVGREASPTRIGIGVFSAALRSVDGTDAFGGTAGSIDGLAIPDGAGSPALQADGGDEPQNLVSLDLLPIETSRPDDASQPSAPGVPLADRFVIDDETIENTDDQGPFNADGTLVKPIAVDTTVPDGKDQLRTYKVKHGDTATDIARRFKVTTATIVWSNGLENAPALKIGQTLIIPPVNGLVHVVQNGDTLSAIARRTGVDFRRIMEANGLDETTVFIGQTLIIPGGKGEHIGTPPAAAGADLSPNSPVRRNTVTVPRRSAVPPATYGGGAFAWPLPGGSISQYFHYGHYGLDIAGDYGMPVHAAASGTVIFAGWKNNGGGWQVWIAHGSG
ncbi:MAG: M23 family metallopeptidase, partial [Chloroflexi bacterium]|nr:M23 family metallopeptidase [Chloroflexota bacterium]